LRSPPSGATYLRQYLVGDLTAPYFDLESRNLRQCWEGVRCQRQPLHDCRGDARDPERVNSITPYTEERGRNKEAMRSPKSRVLLFYFLCVEHASDSMLSFVAINSALGNCSHCHLGHRKCTCTHWHSPQERWADSLPEPS